MVNVQDIERQAKEEVDAEKSEKAKKALVAAYRRLTSAQQLVKNVEAEIEDLKASITDGSFVG